jgi:hypothetical protein
MLSRASKSLEFVSREYVKSMLSGLVKLLPSQLIKLLDVMMDIVGVGLGVGAAGADVSVCVELDSESNAEFETSDSETGSSCTTVGVSPDTAEAPPEDVRVGVVTLGIGAGEGLPSPCVLLGEGTFPLCSLEVGDDAGNASLVVGEAPGESPPAPASSPGVISFSLGVGEDAGEALFTVGEASTVAGVGAPAGALWPPLVGGDSSLSVGVGARVGSSEAIPSAMAGID